MNEPTKEQIDEARILSGAYLWDIHECFAFSIQGLARLIAHVCDKPELQPKEPTHGK